MASSHINNKKKKVARVVVRYKDSAGLNQISCGTGFFVSEDGVFITCFHVAFLQDMENVQRNSYYINAAGTENEKYLAYHKAVIVSIHAVHDDGSQVELSVEKFDAFHDFAVLKTGTGKVEADRVFNMNFGAYPEYGDVLNFVGFPVSFGYDVDKNPFAYSTGYVSAFPDNKIGGSGLYQHIQMNSLNLGGNSGGPLFSGESEEVIGIVNGNMTWGFDNHAFVDGKNQVVKAPFKVPLGVAYATSLKLLREKNLL